MSWSSVLISASELAARLPLDRIFIRPRDKARALEGFVATLPATRPQPATAAPPVSSPVAPEAVEPAATPNSLDKAPEGPIAAPAPVLDHPAPAKEQISPEAMLEYQRRQVYGQILLLQGHAANGSRIDGKACDCLLKHAIIVAALAEETQPMEPSNPLWPEIRNFANGIIPKAQVSDVINGTYTSEYPGMAATARDLRKRIDIGTSPMTLEEAKAEAAKLAEEEVERQWDSQSKKSKK